MIDLSGCSECLSPSDLYKYYNGGRFPFGFKEAAEIARLQALHRTPKKLFSVEKDLEGFPFLKALAEREQSMATSKLMLATIIFIRDVNPQGHEEGQESSKMSLQSKTRESSQLCKQRILTDMASSSTTPKKRGRLEALEKRLSTSNSLSPSPNRPTFTPPRPRDAAQTGSDAPYARLCSSVLNGPLASKLELRPVSDTGAAVGALLRDLLQSNTKFAGNVESTIESRTQDMVLLLDNRATQGRAIERARERARLSRSKRSTKYLSLAQHRKLGSYQLPQAFEKHNVYIPLHEMWETYAESVTASCGSNVAMMQSRLLTADLHGAILAVVDCKTPSYIGLQGIMIRETSKTFGLVTSKDRFAVIPKGGSTFRLRMKNTVVTLFGSGLGLRGATGTTKA